MPISTDDRIDLIFKTQFGKLYTSSELTLGQEDIGYFSFERDQIFGQEIPNVFMSDIVWSDRENFEQIVEYGSKDRLLTGKNYLTQSYSASSNIILLYKLSYNTITPFSTNGTEYNIFSGRTQSEDFTESHNSYFYDYSGNYYDFQTTNDTIVKYITFNSDDEFNKNAPSHLNIYGKNDDDARWEYIKNFKLTHQDYSYDQGNSIANDIILDISFNEDIFKNYRIAVNKILNDNVNFDIIISGGDVLWTNSNITNWTNYPWNDYSSELEAIGLKIYDTDNNYISNITNEPIWIRIDLNPSEIEPWQWQMYWDNPNYLPQQEEDTEGPTITTTLVENTNVPTTRISSSQTSTWVSQYNYAISQGKRLPYRSEILNNQNTLMLNGQDQWVAGLINDTSSDSSNRDWYQIGTSPHYYGKSHVQHQGGYPSWGDDSQANDAREFSVLVETAYTTTFNYDKYDGNMQIVNEYNCTHILTADGELYGWGYNGHGEIGINNYSNYNYPQKIASSYFSNKRIVKICRVCFHASCALTDEGEVYAWGNGSYGAFLKGNTSNYSRPELLTWFSDNNIKIVDVTGGYYHWLALSDQGKVYTWGFNGHGQRGIGNANSYNNDTAPFELSDFDNSNNELYGKEVIFIKAREYHCMAVTSDNELYTWGNNGEYTLGHGNNTTAAYYPKKVNFNWGGTIVQIDAVYRGCMVLINNGTVYNWGAGEDYCLGNNITSDQGSPIVPLNLIGVNIVKIAGGRDFFKFALSADGTLYGWGKNSSYRLGVGHTNNVQTPVVVMSGVTDIYTGYACAFAVANGKIWSWGYGNYSQHRPWANNTGDIQIPEQWPDNFANNYMNGATTGFQYEGTQIASDYINLNILAKKFGATTPIIYSESFYSAAWNDNPGGNYDKVRGYRLPIIRQIGPKANINDIWGSKLRLYNNNSNSYHTSPNNYSNTEPWIKVTFLSNIDNMREKPIAPLRNPHALMNSNINEKYNGSMNWQQLSTTRLLENNEVPGNLQNYWKMHIIKLEHYRDDGQSSWIHPDAVLLTKKSDAVNPNNTLFNNSDKKIYVEITINDNLKNDGNFQNGEIDKNSLLPKTVDWYGDTPWILYSKNDLSDNLIEDSNDQYIRTYPYIIELNPGEWITRMAIPEYYNVYTDIPEKSWANGNNYPWKKDEERSSLVPSTYNWYGTNGGNWWKINIYNQDPRLHISYPVPFNLQTSDTWKNPSNDGYAHINNLKIYGRDVYDINDIFNGEIHYDNPNKVWGYGNNETTTELLDASNVSITTEEKLLTNLKREIMILNDDKEPEPIREGRAIGEDLVDLLMEEDFEGVPLEASTIGSNNVTTRISSSQTSTWVSQYNYAISQGKRLPYRSEILDNQNTLLVNGQDEWVAGLRNNTSSSSSNRDWYQIGNSSHVYGKSHVVEQGGYPSWGDSASSYSFRDYSVLVEEVATGDNVWSNLMPDGWTVKTYNDHETGVYTEFNGWRIANPYWLDYIQRFVGLPEYQFVPGLKFEYYSQGYFSDNVNWFNSYTPTATGYTSHGDNIGTLSNNTRTVNSAEYYSFQWTGYFKPNVTGSHSFYIASDDASYLWLGTSAVSGYTTGNAFVNNGGAHGVQWRSASINLTAGRYYPMRMQFGERTGGDNMIIYFVPPGGGNYYNGTDYYWSLAEGGFAEVSEYLDVSAPNTSSIGLSGYGNYDGNIQVRANYHQTFVLDENNDLWAWGYNGYGQLGTGNTSNYSTPARLRDINSALNNVTIDKICEDYHSTFIITDTGEVWSWGYGHYGEHLNNSTSNIYTPTRIPWFPNNNVVISNLEVGYHCVVAMSNQGKLYAWGYNSHGQRGAGFTSSWNGTNGTAYMTSPHLIVRDNANNSLTNAVFTQISCRSYVCMALRDNGQLYTWGHGSNGGLCQLNTSNYYYPTIVTNQSTWGGNIVQIEGCYYGGMVLLDTGEVYGWGYNSHYNLGVGNTNYSSSGIKPHNLPSNMIRVKSGYYSRYAIASNGELWGWGYNGHGQMGDGGTSHNTTADRVRLNSSTYMSGVTDIVSGVHHTIIYANGQLYGLGYGYYGNNVTNGNTGNDYYPVLWSNQFNVTGSKIVKSEGMNTGGGLLSEIKKYTEPSFTTGKVAAIIPLNNYLEGEVVNTHSGLRTPELNIFNYYKNSLEVELKSSIMEGTNIRINAIYDDDENNKVILLNKTATNNELYKYYKIPLLNPLYAEKMKVEFECWGENGFWILNDVKVTNNQKYTTYKSQFTNVIQRNLNFYTFTSSGTYNSNHNEEKAFDGLNTGFNYSNGGWLANFSAPQFGWDDNGYYNKQSISYSYYTQDVNGNIYHGPWIEVERLIKDKIYYIEIYPTQNTSYASSGHNEGGRQPRNFRLYGSNNNLDHASNNSSLACLHCSTDWHLIQEWIDIDSQNYWDGEYKHFTGIIDNPGNYKKYRLAINRITVPYHNHDDVGSNSNLERLHIGAINFYGLNDKVYNNIVTYTSPEREQLSNIIIDTNNKSKVYYFKIYSSNIERGYDAPSDFKLLGSDISNNSWTIVQEWNDIKAYEYYNGSFYIPYIGTLNIPTTYRYWKLEITKSTGFKMQLKQFELYGSEINLSKYIEETTLSIEDYNTADDSIDNRVGEVIRTDPNENMDDKTGLLTGPNSITRNTTITYLSSTEYYGGFNAFTGTGTTGNGWISEANCYNSNGYYIKEEKSQTNEIFGEWIQINFENQYVGTKIKLYQNSGNILRAPEKFILFGSNDNMEWIEVKKWSEKTQEVWVENSYILTLDLSPEVKLYKHWRLVTEKVIGYSSATPAGAMSISEFELYGYKQQYINLQDYVYAGVNTIEEAFDLYGSQITQSTYNIEPYKLIFDLSKNLINFYNLSSNDIEIFTQLKNEKAISYDKNYNTTEFKVTGSYYTNENMLNLFIHSYKFAMSNIDVSQLFNDKLSEYSLNLEFVNDVYNGNNEINGYGGDWIEIDTKIPIKVSEIKLYLNETGDSNVKLYDTPKEYRLYAINPGEENWNEVGTFITSDIDIVEEEISNYLPIELNNNNIDIPGYFPSNNILYTSKIIESVDLLQLFEWNKNNIKITPVSRQQSTNIVGSINNLDGDGDPFVNAIYGHGSSYVWESEDNYDVANGKYLGANSLMDIMYEDQLGEWLQVDLGESKPLGFMTLRPICGNVNKLLNPGPGSEITIYGSNNLQLWSEVKKLENINWGEADENSVLNFKLIEIDETISFRYWRLLFNKSTGQDDYVAEYTVYDTTYEPFTRYDESQKFHAPMDGEGGYWGEEYFGYAATFTGSRQLSLSPYVNQEYVFGQARPKFIVNNPGSSIKIRWRSSANFARFYYTTSTGNVGTPGWNSSNWTYTDNKTYWKEVVLNHNHWFGWQSHSSYLGHEVEIIPAVSGIDEIITPRIVPASGGYNTRVGLSEWKLYSPFSSLSNMITGTLAEDIIKVRTITKSVTLTSEFYRYWRLVINEKHAGLSNQIKLKQIEMKGLELKHDNNLLTLWRPEINKPIENYLILDKASSSDVSYWGLSSLYNLSGVNLVYRDTNHSVYTNINKTFDLELFKDIKGIFNTQTVEEIIQENKYMDVSSVEMISYIKSINSIRNSENKYDYIKRYENVKLERVRNTFNRAWHPKNNIMKEKLKNIIQGRTPFYFELETNIVGANIINVWDGLYKPIVRNGILVFLGEKSPLDSTTLSFKAVYIFEGYTAPNAIVRQLDNDPTYIGEEPYLFYNKTEKRNKITTGENREFVPIGYDSFVQEFCNHPKKMKNLTEEVKYYEVENTTNIPSGWQKLPIVLMTPITVTYDGTNFTFPDEITVKDNDLFIDVNTHKMYRYEVFSIAAHTGWKNYYLNDLQDISNNNQSNTAWTNAIEGHIYSINPYTFKQKSEIFLENNVNDGDIYIYVNSNVNNKENIGIYQYNNDLKLRNVIYKWESIISWRKENIFITNFIGETPYTDPSGASCIENGNFIALPIINRIKMAVFKNEEEPLTDLSNVTLFTKGDNQLYRPDEFPNEMKINLWTTKIEFNNNIFGDGYMNQGTYKIELWYENNSTSMVRNKNEIFVTIN